MKKIHFLGVGGSGVNAIAALAAEKGYEVSGCDVNKETAYTERLHKLGIKTFVGHSKDHLEGCDMLIVTPAIYFMNQDNEEVQAAREKMPVLTWEEFLGKHLLVDKKVICVAGTHGKSTTTAILSLVLQKEKLEPSAVVGAKVKDWGGNSLNGNGEFFVVEADEFNDNFLHYKPDTIILNNIEFDHPDFFETEEDVILSFSKFIKNLKGNRNLIFNQDSEGVQKLFETLGENGLEGMNLVGYTLGTEKINLENSTQGKIIKSTQDSTEFQVTYPDKTIETYKIKIPGSYNVANALGVILASKICGVSKDSVDYVLENFEGIGRRLELIGEKKDIKVYDDYAHHPTAVSATLTGLRQLFPANKIWVILEAHGYARTKALLGQYKNAFSNADEVIIGPIFKARDAHNFGVDEKSIADASNHPNVSYTKDFSEILNRLKNDVKATDVILVMGAGESYIWAREILKNI